MVCNVQHHAAGHDKRFTVHTSDDEKYVRLVLHDGRVIVRVHRAVAQSLCPDCHLVDATVKRCREEAQWARPRRDLLGRMTMLTSAHVRSEMLRCGTTVEQQ
jgi:hypothetical protein